MWNKVLKRQVHWNLSEDTYEIIWSCKDWHMKFLCNDYTATILLSSQQSNRILRTKEEI